MAKIQSAEAERDFVQLSESLSIGKIQLWTSEEKHTQEQRDINISAMDVYDVKNVESK